MRMGGAIRRIASGVPGLDTLLGGGLLQGGMYLVVGRPGVGKTILANQLCFHHVAEGGRVGYVTLLAETHARMAGHLCTLDFAPSCASTARRCW